MTNNIREKQESVLQLHAQPAINQCPLDYKIRMNQYAYISELNKITMHIFRNVWLTVEKKRLFIQNQWITQSKWFNICGIAEQS